MAEDLFSDHSSLQAQWIQAPQSDLRLFPQLFSREESDTFFSQLRDGINWQAEKILMYGKPVTVPRLTAWYGEPEAGYCYSNVMHTPLAWTRELLAIKARVEQVSAKAYNSVLLNLYRDGQDSVAWHSDDEAELGRNPTIASVSFGAERTFQMKHRRIPGARLSIPLGHGSCLIMQAETQHHWLHQIPKSKKVRSARINLTFRQIYPVDRQASG